MYYKTLAVLVAALCVVSALPKHGSHGAPVHERQAEHHAPATSFQHFDLHNSGGHGGGDGDGGHHGHHEEHHGHPKYEFEYKVEDPHTGDNKYQKESRDGDKVYGVYHFVEADGRLRTVKYHADKHSGFNAEVIHSGHAHHDQPKHHH